MAEARSNIDSIDAMLDRLVKATDQITKASEKQAARKIDRQLKRLIDRGEGHDRAHAQGGGQGARGTQIAEVCVRSCETWSAGSARCASR